MLGRISQGMLGRADKGTVQKGSIQLLRFRIKFGMTVLVKFGMTVLVKFGMTVFLSSE